MTETSDRGCIFGQENPAKMILVDSILFRLFSLLSGFAEKKTDFKAFIKTYSLDQFKHLNIST